MRRPAGQPRIATFVSFRRAEALMQRRRIWVSGLSVVAVIAVVASVILYPRWQAFAREAEEQESWATGYFRKAREHDKGRVDLRTEADAWEADLGKPEYTTTFRRREIVVDDAYRKKQAASNRRQADQWDAERKKFLEIAEDAARKARNARRRW